MNAGRMEGPTSVVTLAGNVLVADQVHAIPQGGHQGDICDSVKGAKLMEWQLLVQVVDGQMRQRPISAVDPAHHLMYHAAQPLHAHKHQLESRTRELFEIRICKPCCCMLCGPAGLSAVL